jgi:hypothetical protein
MHGTEHCIEERWVSRRSAPPVQVSLDWDQCLPPHRSFSLLRSRSLVTAFRSPATAAPFPGPPFRGQRSWPATSRPTSLCPRPVRLQLHRFYWFAPGKSRFFAVGPLRLSRAGSLDCFPCLHSPPGLLHPSGSKRSTGPAVLRLAFRIRPISSRSPLPVLFLGLAADQRSWFATLPEACRCL